MAPWKLRPRIWTVVHVVAGEVGWGQRQQAVFEDEAVVCCCPQGRGMIMSFGTVVHKSHWFQ